MNENNPAQINKKCIVLSEIEYNYLRSNFPRINLYEEAIIGTEDIRQYVYCKRIIYYRYVLRAPMVRSYKMERGIEKHEKLHEVNQLTKKDQYLQKYYNIYLTAPKFGLVGLIDYFEFDGKEAYPVEFKSGNMPPESMQNPHKYQAAAQALLIESNFDFHVRKIKLVYSKINKTIEHSIMVDDKLKVMTYIDEIRNIIFKERIPLPTKDIGKCIDCECRKYCEGF